MEANHGSASRIYQKRFFYQLQVKIQMVLSIGTFVHGQVYQWQKKSLLKMLAENVQFIMEGGQRNFVHLQFYSMKI